MQGMYTVIELPLFQRQVEKIWTQQERHAFIDWIAANPLAGDVIPGSKAGARKVRWQASGRGKRGGARVIYYHFAEDGVLALVQVYTKSERENITAKEIEKGV